MTKVYTSSSLKVFHFSRASFPFKKWKERDIGPPYPVVPCLRQVKGKQDRDLPHGENPVYERDKTKLTLQVGLG